MGIINKLGEWFRRLKRGIDASLRKCLEPLFDNRWKALFLMSVAVHVFCTVLFYNEIRGLTSRIGLLEKEILQLKHELGECKRENWELKIDNWTLKRTINELKIDNWTLKRTINELNLSCQANPLSAKASDSGPDSQIQYPPSPKDINVFPTLEDLLKPKICKVVGQEQPGLGPDDGSCAL